MGINHDGDGETRPLFALPGPSSQGASSSTNYLHVEPSILISEGHGFKAGKRERQDVWWKVAFGAVGAISLIGGIVCCATVNPK